MQDTVYKLLVVKFFYTTELMQTRQVLAEGSKLKIKSYLQCFLLKVTPFLQIVFIILLDMKMSDLRGFFFLSNKDDYDRRITAIT